MRSITTFIFLWIGILSCGFAQNLKRRPFLGVQLSPVSDSLASAGNLKSTEGALVVQVIPKSTAATLRVQPNDVIVRVNQAPVKTYTDVVDRARQFKTGENVTLELIRKGKRMTLKGKVQPMPFETDPNADVLYDEVALGNNAYARSIIKKPKGKGKYPAVFFIQGYGCNSIDNLPADNPQRLLLDGLVAKGYAVYRMEKPGMGDSQGTQPCTEISYTEELAAFAAGLKELKQYDFVDTENIFLFGHSLGGNTAPLIAADEKVKGIIVYGITGKPWGEYLIELFREQSPMNGTDYVQVEEDMKTLLPLVYELMVLKKSPGELAQNAVYKPYLERRFDYDGRGHLFGRHYTFLQQLNDIPLNKAWKAANAHTLAIYGEADIPALNPDGAKLVVDVVNSYYPGKATYQFLPRTDHGFMEVGTKEDYRRLQSGAAVPARFNQKLVDLVDSWIKERLRKA
ncbi:alpha/beta fold hydrolase [Pontibacter ruber]|uniref:Alpha/beta fold hydrolase n=1 Tax=Pontibacter ruber TaxID=1343895 RepID=A0ABW5CRU1_9BACT|nr:alpha/beta fold hydrolase [Pontibacter ruber]